MWQYFRFYFYTVCYNITQIIILLSSDLLVGIDSSIVVLVEAALRVCRALLIKRTNSDREI